MDDSGGGAEYSFMGGWWWLIRVKSHPERIHDRPASVDAQEDGFAACGPFCPLQWTSIAHSIPSLV